MPKSSAASWATRTSRRWRFRRGQDGPEEVVEHTDELTDRLNGQPIVGTQETIVTNLHETGRKHVLKKAPDKLDSIDRGSTPLAGLLVFV